MLYNTAYHPQTDSFSKQINQTIEIVLYFFIHGLDNPFIWSIALLAIQSIINNTFSLTISKTSNEIACGFTHYYLLDLLSTLLFFAIATTRIEAIDAFSFVMANQKTYYNQKYQLLFMKKGKWAMLQLHKGYSIFAALEVIKKLTQQYMGPFQIKDKVGWLAYKLKIPPN